MADLQITHTYADVATFGHRLVGVNDKVVNNLADLPLIDIDRPEVVVFFDTTFHLGSTEDELRAFFDHLRNGRHLECRCATLRKREQLLSEQSSL